MIGAGIVGLAHAWREAVHGAEVTLFERDQRAQGASVRNFGMVWPIGQAPQTLPTALASRRLWDEAASEMGAWRNEQGSIMLATRDDEWQVLTQFADSAADHGYECRLLTTEEAARLCPAVRTDRVIGALHSKTEMGVDPREVILKAPNWLAQRYGVQLEFGAAITEVSLPTVSAADGRRWSFDRVTLANGSDLATLYPEVFAEAGLSKCKLQMLRTARQPGGWRQGPMVASGLSLRHYAAFDHCESLPVLRERVAAETPELDAYGIHVMAAQNGSGEVVLGDSHEYGDQVSPFDSEEINRLVLRELRELIDLPDWSIVARWHGVYAIQPSREVLFTAQPASGVLVSIVTGGCGMTMGFGLAEQLVAGSTAAVAAS